MNKNMWNESGKNRCSKSIMNHNCILNRTHWVLGAQRRYKSGSGSGSVGARSEAPLRLSPI